MTLDYATLDALRRQHPTWRLLASKHAPLIGSFLYRAFITPNVRVMAQSDLVEAQEVTLFNRVFSDRKRSQPSGLSPSGRQHGGLRRG